MKNKKLLVAYFQTQQKAEDAIVKLKKNGYDIKKLSLIGTECYTEQSVLGYFNVYDKMEKWTTIGLFVVALSGMILGSLFFFNIGMSIPNYKMPIIYACTAILIVAIIPLLVLGFTRNKTITYKTEIKARKFMLCADETVSQIDKMRTLLHIHVPKENSITERENQVLLENQTYEL